MAGFSVRTQDLALRYGRTTVLSDINLDLGADRIHGLLGRNGTGKTTLLSAIAAFRPAAVGSIEVDGRDPFEDEFLMERVCLVRESGDVLGDEPIRITLNVLEQTRPTFDRAYAEHLLDAFGLGPLKRKAQSLSRGQKSMLGAAIGLASRTPVTMFDEVHLGMDAHARQRFYDELLVEFTERPRTFIISSHLISEVESLLETVTILDQGGVLLSAEADDLRTRGATLTGPADAVAAAVGGQTVVGRRELGPTHQVTLFGDLDPEALDQARTAGLQVGPVPLQDLFIHLTNDREAS